MEEGRALCRLIYELALKRDLGSDRALLRVRVVRREPSDVWLTESVVGALISARVWSHTLPA